MRTYAALCKDSDAVLMSDLGANLGVESGARIVSFARDGAWTTQLLPPEYTLDNYRKLALDRGQRFAHDSAVGSSGVSNRVPGHWPRVAIEYDREADRGADQPQHEPPDFLLFGRRL